MISFAMRGALVLLVFAILLLPLIPETVEANPSGALVTYVSNSTAGIGNAGNRNDARGTITTIILNATQQDNYWKAYVGNVTGALTLDDASGYTIYNWDMAGVTITGQVYVTRSPSTTFTNVACANTTVISTEETFNNMTDSSADSINRTFNYTSHSSFYVGSIPIASSSCRSTATFINDTPQTVNESAKFQEILLQDGSSNLLYTTPIENNEAGFDNNNYDFQIIVGESKYKPTPTTYYFYVEIS